MADPAEVALRVVNALGDAGLSCAIGGALALGRWVSPRATLDADINVFAGEADYERILATMEALGADFEPQACLSRFQAGDVAFFQLDDVRVDLFVPSIPFYEAAANRVVFTEVEGKQVPFLSAETLAVFKLLFFRAKDLRDLEVLVEELGTALDGAWVRGQIVEMLGEDDERVEAWDGLVKAAGA